MISSNLVEERQIAEAPWLMYSQGYYYLFYSSGWFLEPKYHMRVARSKKPTGPFIKRKKPLLSTDWGRYNTVSTKLWWCRDNSCLLGAEHIICRAWSWLSGGEWGTVVDHISCMAVGWG